MKFKSAVDTWFYFLIAFEFGIMLMVLVLVALTGASPAALAIIVGASALAVGLPLWILRSTYYAIDGDQLLIRSGPISWKISIDQIQGVKSSHSLLSSPALSMNRIEIEYGEGKRVMVSPEDRQGFLAAIGQTLRG